jgi:phage/plasmid-like protein (TIGR03299 family)
MAYRKRSEADRPWHDSFTHCTAWLIDPDIPTVLHDLEAYIDVVIRPLYDQNGEVVEEANETWRPFCDAAGNPIKDKDGIVRGQRLGVVGPHYTVVQDSDVVNWFKPWVEAGLATIETGGAIYGGSRFWVLAKLSKDPIEIVSDDAICQYVLAFNGHDGKVSFLALPTDVRVVCNNTLNIALQSKMAKKYKARHNRLVHMKVEEIREDIEQMHEMFLETGDKFKHLAAHNVKDEDQLKLYFQKVLREKEDLDKEIKDDGKRPLDVLMRLFDDSEYQQLSGVKGTWWAAYNCVTEFTTHLRGRNSDTRLDNMIYGMGQELNSRALKIGLAASDGLLAVSATDSN